MLVILLRILWRMFQKKKKKKEKNQIPRRHFFFLEETRLVCEVNWYETFYVNTNLDFRIASSLSVPNVEKKIYISLFFLVEIQGVCIYIIYVCVWESDERPLEESGPRCQLLLRVVRGLPFVHLKKELIVFCHLWRVFAQLILFYFFFF